jgi:arginyl-tRNA synthetase
MLENHIRQCIQLALRSLALPSVEKSDFAVTTPKNPDHGDFATNAALVLAKAASMQPRALAEAICKELAKDTATFTHIEIAGPGFINMRLTDATIQSVVPKVLAAGEAYGSHKADHPKRVLIEFVSANPTGPIHLGHARGTFIGDALGRLLRAAGHEVTCEFYINDVGNQVQTLGRSVFLRYKELYGEAVTLEKGEYPGAYIIDIAKTLKEQDGDKWRHVPESEAIEHCMHFAISENLKAIRTTLESAKVRFDNWYSEATLHEKKLPERLIEDYKRLGMVYEAEASEGTNDKVRREESKAAHYAHQQLGGLFLRTSQFGDEEDRILVRQNGTPVYLVADLAYHREKFERGFDQLINVFGADHANHVQRLRAGMAALGFDAKKLQCVTVQIVRMMRDGKEVRFSKRSGEVELLSDLLDEVGGDVARFVFIMRAANSQFDFDLDLALKKSSDNPVFYVQYGHARMATLLRKAAEDGKAFGGAASLTPEVLARLKLAEERNMIKKIAAFPEVVAAAANSLEPHRVLYYCQELIAEFHSYFTKYRHAEKIISDDAELTAARLGLVAALKLTLFNALNLLGISAPESMYQESVDDGIV